MTTRPKIIDRDRGYKALISMVDKISRDKPAVAIGVLGTKGSAVHRSVRSKRKGKRPPRQGPEKALTVAQIAAKHETGDGVPRRAAIGPTIDAHKSTYRAGIVRGFQATVQYHVQRRIPWDAANSVALRRLGLQVVGDIKKRIAAGISPPLSPYTLRLKGKGKTTPLIDTGHLISAYTFEVRAKT